MKHILFMAPLLMGYQAFATENAQIRVMLCQVMQDRNGQIVVGGPMNSVIEYVVPLTAEPRYTLRVTPMYPGSPSKELELKEMPAPLLSESDIMTQTTQYIAIDEQGNERMYVNINKEMNGGISAEIATIDGFLRAQCPLFVDKGPRR